MSDSNGTHVSVGCGPSGGTSIFIVLLLLKVFGVVDWSWWIITMPLWIGLAIWGAIIGIGGAFAAIVFPIAWAWDRFDTWKRRRRYEKRRRAA